MSPCVYEPLDNWARFCHGNRRGIQIVDGIWWVINWAWRRGARFDQDDNMKWMEPERQCLLGSDGLAVSNSDGKRIGVSLRLRIELISTLTGPWDDVAKARF